MSRVEIRSITEADIPRLVAIERSITHQEAMTPLEKSIHNYLYYGNPQLCLAAEAAGEVVGFLIGEVRAWEFGHEQVAWIKVVGVDPGHKGRGVGRALGEAFLKALRAQGVRRVKTLVEADSPDLKRCFKALGFAEGDQMVLERPL